MEVPWWIVPALLVIAVLVFVVGLRWASMPAKEGDKQPEEDDETTYELPDPTRLMGGNHVA